MHLYIMNGRPDWKLPKNIIYYIDHGEHDEHKIKPWNRLEPSQTRQIETTRQHTPVRDTVSLILLTKPCSCHKWNRPSKYLTVMSANKEKTKCQVAWLKYQKSFQ